MYGDHTAEVLGETGEVFFCHDWSGLGLLGLLGFNYCTSCGGSPFTSSGLSSMFLSLEIQTICIYVCNLYLATGGIGGCQICTSLLPWLLKQDFSAFRMIKCLALSTWVQSLLHHTYHDVPLGSWWNMMKGRTLVIHLWNIWCLLVLLFSIRCSIWGMTRIPKWQERCQVQIPYENYTHLHKYSSKL